MLTFSCFAFSAAAQINRGVDGEIDDAEIIIEKNRKLDLPELAKPLEVIKDPVKPPTQVPQKYTYQDFNIVLPPVESKVKVISLPPNPLDKLYNTYVRAGAGNYGTTYLEGFYNTKRNTDYDAGVHFRHFNSANGPVDNIPSGSGSQLARAYSTYYGKKLIVNGELSYLRERYNFFGYNVPRELSADSVRQVFNTLDFKVNLANADTNAVLNYSSFLGFTSFSDALRASETDLTLGGNTSYRINTTLKAQLGLFAGLTNLEDSTSIGRNLIRVSPGLSYRSGRLQVYTGARIVFENDTITTGGGTRLYPDVSVNYQLVPGQISAFGGFNGDMERTTLRGFTRANPWLMQRASIFHTNKQIEAFAGLTASLTPQFQITARAAIKQYRNLPTYLNNSMGDTAKFAIVYDTGSVQVFNPAIELSYQANKYLHFSAQGQVNSYSMDGLERPWHLPAFTANFLTSYTLKEKITIGLNLHHRGSVWALTPNTFEEVELKALTDIDLQVEYRFSPRFGAFIHADNILNQQTDFLYNYPTRGFLIMLGVSGSF